MNILVLAAGYGVRLHPITHTVSKALLDVGGRPMVEHVVRRFTPFAGDGKVVVVTNAKFSGDFRKWLGRFDEVPVELIDDGTTAADHRLGANGDIELAVRRAGLRDAELLVVGADNYFTEAQDSFVEFAASKPATIATCDLKCFDAVKSFASVETDSSGRVISFEEKPVAPKTTCAGTMLYHLSSDAVPLVSEYLASGGNPDNAGYFFDWLGAQVATYAHPLAGEWIDVGSHDALERARLIAANGV